MGAATGGGAGEAVGAGETGAAEVGAVGWESTVVLRVICGVMMVVVVVTHHLYQIWYIWMEFGRITMIM